MRLGPADPLPQEVARSLRQILHSEGRLRDLALLNTHIDTCARACDVLTLRVGDVRTPEGRVRNSFHLRQKKTGIVVECRLFSAAKEALADYLATRPGVIQMDRLFPGRNPALPLSIDRYLQLIEDWKALLRWNGIPYPERFATHSLRKAKPAYLYDATKDEVACAELLGHTSLKHTRRYLGSRKAQAHKFFEVNQF